MTYTNSITSKGQTTIPKEFRQRFGLDRAGKATFRVNDRGELTITTPRSMDDIRRQVGKPAGDQPLTARERAVISQISEQ